MIFNKIKKYFDITRLIKYIKLKLHRHPATPEDLALSFSLGVFVGVMPTIGAATVLSIALAFAFRVPKIPCFLGTFISNPWTTPIFYTLSLKIGNKILNTDFLIKNFLFFFDKNLPLYDNFTHLKAIYKPLALGGVFISLPIALLFYYSVLFYLKKSQNKRLKKSKIFNDNKQKFFNNM